MTEKETPPQIPDWSIVSLILPGTLNVVRIVVAPRFQHKGTEIIIVGDYVFHPKMDPRIFKATVDIACAAAGRAAAGFVKGGKIVGINPSAIFGVCDMAVEAIRRKMGSAIINANGERNVEVDKQGVVMGDIAEILNMPGNGTADPVIASDPMLAAPQVEEQTTPIEAKEPDPEIKLDF